MTLNRGCHFEECEERPEIPKHNYAFTKIVGLANVANEARVDVIGVIESAQDLHEYTNKTGKNVKKRVLVLADDSGKTIEATVWGENGAQPAIAPGAVLMAKGARVSDWNGKSLSMFDCEINLDVQETHALLGWWQSGGQAQPKEAISIAGSGGGGGAPARQIVFADIENEAIGLNGEKADFFSVKATVTHLKTDKTMWYIACPTCKKKVQGASDDTTLDGRDITRGYIDPVAIQPPTDTVLRLRGNGDYRIYREVLRDDQVASCFNQRQLAVVGKEWAVDPGGKTRKDKAAAQHLEEQRREI